MFNIFNIIISFGALQGFIVGFWLLSVGFKAKTAKFNLSLLLIGLAAVLARVTIIDIQEADRLPPLHINFILLIAPALYGYVKTLTHQHQSDLSVLAKRFSPFFLINLGYLLFYLVGNNSPGYQNTLQSVISIDESLGLLYLGTYVFLTFRFLKNNQAYLTKNHLSWLNKLLLFHLFFLIIWLFYYLAELFFFQYKMEVTTYYPIMVLISGALYYMGIQVMMARETVFESKPSVSRKTQVLNDQESKTLIEKLTILMQEDKPFLDGELSLTLLARSLKVNPKALSFVINEHIQKNFNDYVNDWRIEEVKLRLNQAEYSHLKILGIALDCGFNSKSTFNLAFKKATGKSPSAFRKEP